MCRPRIPKPSILQLAEWILRISLLLELSLTSNHIPLYTTIQKDLVFPKFKIVQCIHKNRRRITDLRALWKKYTPPGNKPLKFCHFNVCFKQGFYISRIRKVAELLYCIGSPCVLASGEIGLQRESDFFLPVTRDFTSENNQKTKNISFCNRNFNILNFETCTCIANLH